MLPDARGETFSSGREAGPHDSPCASRLWSCGTATALAGASAIRTSVPRPAFWGRVPAYRRRDYGMDSAPASCGGTRHFDGTSCCAGQLPLDCGVSIIGRPVRPSPPDIGRHCGDAPPPSGWPQTDRPGRVLWIMETEVAGQASPARTPAVKATTTGAATDQVSARRLGQPKLIGGVLDHRAVVCAPFWVLQALRFGVSNRSTCKIRRPRLYGGPLRTRS